MKKVENVFEDMSRKWNNHRADGSGPADHVMAWLGDILMRHSRNQTKWPRQPSHPNLSGMQEEKKAGTEFSFKKQWLHKSFLHSLLPGFLRGIHDSALSQLLPFCAQISPIRY